MKVALIPPVPELDNFGRGDFHLLLSHLSKHQEYRRHYFAQRQKGAYLVLDNSAHEFGAGQSAEHLVAQAVYYQAQEVVVPDVLDNCEATIDSAIASLEAWFEGESRSMKDLNPSLMYVPQGKDYDDWRECLVTLVRLHRHQSRHHAIRRDFVIGISKDYEVWEGGLLRLLENDIYPLVRDHVYRGVKVSVHLLGWGRDLWALNEISRTCPWIRSTDSAKPFVYALSGIELDDSDRSSSPEYPGRPEDYFERTFDIQQARLAHANVGMFRKQAQ